MRNLIGVVSYQIATRALFVFSVMVLAPWPALAIEIPEYIEVATTPADEFADNQSPSHTYTHKSIRAQNNLTEKQEGAGEIDVQFHPVVDARGGWPPYVTVRGRFSSSLRGVDPAMTLIRLKIGDEIIDLHESKSRSGNVVYKDTSDGIEFYLKMGHAEELIDRIALSGVEHIAFRIEGPGRTAWDMTKIDFDVPITPKHWEEFLAFSDALTMEADKSTAKIPRSDSE